jgi:hypothetical protein
MRKKEKFEVLKDKTILNLHGFGAGSYTICITCTDGTRYEMFHILHCCENVCIQDIIGDPADIMNSPILLAEEVSSCKDPPKYKKTNSNSFTWTFYKLSTIKGSVTIRWLGESNGFYSESVDFYRVK